MKGGAASDLALVGFPSPECWITIGKGLLSAYEECSERGIRGGAIYDYPHLAAARNAGVSKIYTLNTADFLAFHPGGRPTDRATVGTEG